MAIRSCAHTFWVESRDMSFVQPPELKAAMFLCCLAVPLTVMSAGPVSKVPTFPPIFHAWLSSLPGDYVRCSVSFQCCPLPRHRSRSFPPPVAMNTEQWKGPRWVCEVTCATPSVGSCSSRQSHRDGVKGEAETSTRRERGSRSQERSKDQTSQTSERNPRSWNITNCCG